MSTAEENNIQDRKDGLRENVRVGRGTRLAALGLLVLALILGGANIVSSYFQNRSFESELAQQYRTTEQQQQAQGKLIDSKLCATLSRLAALKPPSGDAGNNPSRAYEQQLAMTLAQLKPDVGCLP
jgi:type VI protein secretion system component VasK